MASTSLLTICGPTWAHRSALATWTMRAWYHAHGTLGVCAVETATGPTIRDCPSIRSTSASRATKSKCASLARTRWGEGAKGRVGGTQTCLHIETPPLPISPSPILFLPPLLRLLRLCSFLTARRRFLRRLCLLLASRRHRHIDLLVNLLLTRLPVNSRFDCHILLQRGRLQPACRNIKQNLAVRSLLFDFHLHILLCRRLLRLAFLCRRLLIVKFHLELRLDHRELRAL